MNCEVCGRQIVGKPFKVVIEGAKMVVCGNCVKLGSAYWEERPQRRVKKTAKPLPRISISGKRQPPALAEALELVDDFSLRIRRARERMELSHEDLGRKIGEKVSVLRKIESGKMTPDHRLAEKLQHALRVELLVSPSEPKVPSTVLFQPREVTLGDVILLKKRKTEVNEERKPS